MCLVLLAWRAHSEFPLIVAANRDEYFNRPALAAHWWADFPEVLAIEDVSGSGTWLGISRGGRFAALTNYRDPHRVIANAPSRGGWVSRFLHAAVPPEDFLQENLSSATAYNGFNLFVASAGKLFYFSNLEGRFTLLPPGVYGLSNHLLNTPWPKVQAGRSRLETSLASVPDREPLFRLLRDDRIAPDDQLPSTGVSLEWERLLSAAFVRSPDYGTRCSTVLLRRADGSGWFEERSFGPAALETGRVSLELPAYHSW